MELIELMQKAKGGSFLRTIAEAAPSRGVREVHMFIA